MFEFAVVIDPRRILISHELTKVHFCVKMSLPRREGELLNESEKRHQSHDPRRNRASLAFCLPMSFGKLSIVMTAAVLAAAFLWSIGSFSASPKDASASAAEVLNTLSKVAADQPVNLTVTANNYRYLRFEGRNMVTSIGPNKQRFTALVPKTREIWIAPDGSGRIRETVGSPVFLGKRDRANWQAAGSPPLDIALNKDFGPGGLSYEDFSHLPTDPNALAAIIRSRAGIPSGPPANVEMFVIIGDILREPGAPPEVRSTLYKVAAKIEGVELVGNVTDRAGRRGVAVAMTSDYSGARQRLMLIFDPVTATLLGEEETMLDQVDWIDTKPPVVIGYTTYLESGIVTKLP